MPNAYLQRQNAVYDEMLNRGKQHGEQYTMDCVMIALHRQGWGYTRIKRLFDEVSEIADYYTPSMRRSDPEQPIFQERFDAELGDIVKEYQPFYSFKERYPLISEARYDKPLRGKNK